MQNASKWRASAALLALVALLGSFQNCSSGFSGSSAMSSINAPSLVVSSQTTQPSSSAATASTSQTQCSLQNVPSNFFIQETGANQSTLDQGHAADPAGCVQYCQSLNSTFCALQYIQLSAVQNEYYCTAFLNVVPTVSTSQSDYLMAGACSSPAVASCSVVGGAGLQLISSQESQANCQSDCAGQAATHPNLTCSWGATDITPQGSCAIVGGAGLSLFSGTVSRGSCFADCQNELSVHPNESCTWNGINIK